MDPAKKEPWVDKLIELEKFLWEHKLRKEPYPVMNAEQFEERKLAEWKKQSVILYKKRKGRGQLEAFRKTWENLVEKYPCLDSSTYDTKWNEKFLECTNLLKYEQRLPYRRESDLYSWWRNNNIAYNTGVMPYKRRDNWLKFLELHDEIQAHQEKNKSVKKITNNLACQQLEICDFPEVLPDLPELA